MSVNRIQLIKGVNCNFLERNMKIIDRKIDAAIQSYWRRWMNSLERPRAIVMLSNFVITFLILFWSASLTSQLGYDLRKGSGTLIFIGIWFIISLVVLSGSRLMSTLGIDRATRSALILAIALGPYFNLIAYRAWNQFALSQILAFVGSILVFILMLILDKVLSRTPTQAR